MCPRKCYARRDAGERGYCGQGDIPRVARYGLHYYEEPPISGERGSGTVFFCGCSMGCVFCQNRDISRGQEIGELADTERLADMMTELRDMGAHNINLVTPTHFAHKIAEALRSLKGSLGIPVVYNSSGYERVETLRMLDGLVDIYMPDFKYISPDMAEKYSSAPDYARVASEALVEMYRQRGKCVFGEDGMLKSGVLVRHLVLPGGRKDSIAVLHRIAELVPVEDILVSVMSQYTPEFAMGRGYGELERRITSFEYSSVAKEAEALGLNGFMQGRASASSVYTPDFNK